MFSKMMKLIYILVCVFVFVACDDDDHVSNDVKPADCTPMGVNDPHCYGVNTHSVPLEALEEYVSEVHGDGDVVAYHWTEGLAWFLESKKHKYGFDLDPYAMYSEDAPARGRDVYMSVEKGGKEKAWVTVYVDPDAVKIYHLHEIDKNNNIKQRDVIDVSSICSKKTSSEKCKDDFELSEGIYAVYYDTDAGEKDMERYLHILGYPKKVYNIDFVKFGDPDVADCKIDGTTNGCYTWDRVEKRFNEIMSQAVVEGKVNPKNAEDVGLDEFLTIDLTEEYYGYEDDCPVVYDVIEKIRSSEGYGYGGKLEKFKNSYSKLKKICMESGGDFSGDWTVAPTDDGYHYAISYKCPGIKENISDWNLNCGIVDGAFNDVKKENENFEYKHLALGINSMRAQWCVEGRGNGLVELNNLNVFAQVLEKKGETTSLSMFLVPEGGTTKDPVTLTFDHYLGGDQFAARLSTSLAKGKKYCIYTDVYPFVPNEPDAAQVTISYKKSKDEQFIIGGVVWGSHLKGNSSLNTIVHEIGHSLGLKDLFVADDDLTYPPNYARAKKSGKVEIKESFAFNESNVMWWKGESGERLRYRPLFVAQTLNGGRIQVAEDTDGKPVFATERQWECIHSSRNCYYEGKKIER